ncbi:hypothetical protein GCM10020001_023450 [Nonomuraea salmonea]
MKLGVNLSYLDAVEVAREAERLGFDLAVVPEGFRADGATVLGGPWPPRPPASAWPPASSRCPAARRR